MAFPGVVCPTQMVWQNGAVGRPIPFYSSVKAESPVLPSPVSPFGGFNGSTPIADHGRASPVGDSSPYQMMPSPLATQQSSHALKTKRSRRKRCSNCDGCRRTENCGRCAVCTNPNATANSICKNRRCSMLQRRRPSTLVSNWMNAV